MYQKVWRTCKGVDPLFTLTSRFRRLRGRVNSLMPSSYLLPFIARVVCKKKYQTWSAPIVFYYTGTYLCWVLSLFSRTTPKFYINFPLLMGVVWATWYLQIFFLPAAVLTSWKFFHITDNRSCQYVNSPYFPCDKFSPLFSWLLQYVCWY